MIVERLDYNWQIDSAKVVDIELFKMFGENEVEFI